MEKEILVIEDDEAVRKAFVMALEGTGYHVTTVESGRKGLEKVAESDYGLIFLDLKMPKKDGVQTLRELRQSGVKAPIYIVTGFYKEFIDALENAESQGIDFELLQKPVTEEQIRMVARNAFEKGN